MAVAELRSCATALQSLVRSGLHRFSVRLLPRPRSEKANLAGQQPKASPDRLVTKFYTYPQPIPCYRNPTVCRDKEAVAAGATRRREAKQGQAAPLPPSPARAAPASGHGMLLPSGGSLH